MRLFGLLASSPILRPSLDLLFDTPGGMNVWNKERPEINMQIETKYLRLRTPVTLGSFFGDWSVCWLGGWAKDRMYYLVMLVRVNP
jgi:hypothetical protein